MKTREQLDKEYRFKTKLMDDIERIFEEIRASILEKAQAESELSRIYFDLLGSLKSFQEQLISEAVAGKVDDFRPLHTAQKLQTAVNATVSKTLSLEEQDKSITQFRNDARNGNYSMAMKIGISTVAGALLGAAVLATIIIATCGVGVFLAAAAMFAFLGSYTGACIGLQIGAICSLDQDDSRGKDVSQNLTSLTTQRHKLFHKEKTPVRSGFTVTADKAMTFSH